MTRLFLFWLRLFIVAKMALLLASCKNKADDVKTAVDTEVQHNIANTDRSQVGSSEYESEYSGKVKSFSELVSGDIEFELILNRVNLSMPSKNKDNPGLGFPSQCPYAKYIPIENLFNLNKTSFKKRQDYLKNRECINHYYGADINQFISALRYFHHSGANIFYEGNEVKTTPASIKEVLSSNEFKSMLFQRRITVRMTVANFNQTFNTVIKKSGRGEPGYLGYLKLRDKSVAESIRGLVLSHIHALQYASNDKSKSQLNKKTKKIDKQNFISDQGENEIECNPNNNLCYDKKISSYCLNGSSLKSGCLEKTDVFPRELAQIYHFPNNYGKGQSIAIIADYTNYDNLKKHLSDYVRHQYPDECTSESSVNCPVPSKGVNVKLTSNFQKMLAPQDSYESDLDLSIIASVVPQADIYMVGKRVQPAESGTYFMYHEAIYYCLTGSIDNNNCKNFDIISASYGDLNHNSYMQYVIDDLLEDAALRNITVVTSSGDLGSGNKVANDIDYFNTAQPTFQINTGSRYTTSVGGTSFGSEIASNMIRDDKFDWLEYSAFSNEKLGQLRELYTENKSYVWNDLLWSKNRGISLQDFTKNALSSGGASLSPHPQYQENLKAVHFQHCPNKGLCRVYPDIALSAGGAARILDMHVDMFGKPKLGHSGGTSASAPLFAALIARINSILKQENEGFDGVGFINPLLYDLAHSQHKLKSTNTVFKDVRHGNNCSIFNVEILGQKLNHIDELLCYNSKDPSLFYQAGDGYDLATGLGEPQGTALLIGIRNILKKHNNT